MQFLFAFFENNFFRSWRCFPEKGTAGAVGREGRYMNYHPATVEIISQAARKARELGHSYVGSAHFLLALSREGGSTGLVLRQLGVNPEVTEALTQLLYGLGTPDLPLPQGLTPEAKRLLR